jgi:hypothetical protein
MKRRRSLIHLELFRKFVRSLVRGAISLRRTNVSLSGMGGTSNDEVVEGFFVLMTVLAGGTGILLVQRCAELK